MAAADPDRTLPDPQKEPVLRVPRAAAILNLGVRTVYTQIEKDPDFPTIRVGTAVRIPTAQFLAYFGLDAIAAGREQAA